jgi:hypothetical protein
MILSKKIDEAMSMTDDELVSKCESKLDKVPDSELKDKRKGIISYYKGKGKLTDKQRDSLVVFYAGN